MFLVIDTVASDGRKFKHFISLTKDAVSEDFIDFINHFKKFNEEIERIDFAKERLGAW